MTAMTQELSWDAVSKKEGCEISVLSSSDTDEVAGGWWWIIPLIYLLWPTPAY